MIALVAAVVAALLPLAVLYRLVAREDAKNERTATPEMWDRTLQDFQNDERRDGRFPGLPDTAFTNLRG